MTSLRLSSVLPLSYRDELERILFFNPEQGRYITPLLAAVNRYGVPTIVEEEGGLRLRVPSFRAVQALYAIHDDHADDGVSVKAVLAGAAMFVRECEETMLVLHLVVHPDYSAKGPHVSLRVVLRLLAAVRDISRRTRGIRTVRVLYPKETRLNLR